jgi:hypothetical protein
MIGSESKESGRPCKKDPDFMQFRRYAEAALTGINHSRMSYDEAAELSFTQATEMMMMENFYFEQYQLQALEHVVAKQRVKHGIKEPSEPSKVF